MDSFLAAGKKCSIVVVLAVDVKDEERSRILCKLEWSSVDGGIREGRTMIFLLCGQ